MIAIASRPDSGRRPLTESCDNVSPSHRMSSLDEEANGKSRAVDACVVQSEARRGSQSFLIVLLRALSMPNA